MIKLTDILKEMYINKQGELINFSEDIIVKKTGFIDLIIVDADKINLSEYINFKAKASDWKNSSIATSIFNQLMELYKGTALEEYNNRVGFTPKKRILRGSAWDAPALDAEFLRGEIKFGFKTKEDELKNMSSFIGYAPPPLSIEAPVAQLDYSIEGSPWPFDLSCIAGACYKGPKVLGPGEKAKLTTSAEDIEDKMQYTFVNYIPFIAFSARKPIDGLSATPPSGDTNKKSVIKDTFNEFGLAALSYLKNK